MEIHMSGFKEKQMEIVLDWFGEKAIPYLNLAVFDRAKNKFMGEARERDRVEVEKSLSWGAAMNMKGCEVYMRPARWLAGGELAKWPYLYFDDVPDDVVAELSYEAMAIQTSPGLHHVWLALDVAIDEHQRHHVHRSLAAQFKADFGSVSGEHFGRAPGFRNHKRNGKWVSVKRVVKGDKIDISPLLFEFEQSNFSPSAPADKRGLCVSRSSPAAAQLSEQIDGGTESQRDFGYVLGRLRHFSQQNLNVTAEAFRLTSELAEKSRARNKPLPEKYAARTVAAALLRVKG
jgi:hypothetical protein